MYFVSFIPPRLLVSLIAMFRLVPMLLTCSKENSILKSQIVPATFLQLIHCINTETEPLFLSRLLKCFIKSLKRVGGPTHLSPELINGLVEAMRRQLDNIADKRKQEQISKWSIVETWEASALKDAENLLRYLDPKHPLLTDLLSMASVNLIWTVALTLRFRVTCWPW
jgi:importin-5